MRGKGKPNGRPGWFEGAAWGEKAVGGVDFANETSGFYRNGWGFHPYGSQERFEGAKRGDEWPEKRPATGEGQIFLKTD